MTLAMEEFIWNLVHEKAKVSHLDADIDVYVEDVKDVTGEVKKAITKEFGAKFLNDSDYVIYVWHKDNVVLDQDEEKKDDEKPEGDTAEDSKLKSKIADLFKRVFFINNDVDLELFDVTIKDKKYYFAKLAFKE